MRIVREYRRFAEECRILARVVEKPEQRRVLRRMAVEWEELANTREAGLRGQKS